MPPSLGRKRQPRRLTHWALLPGIGTETTGKCVDCSLAEYSRPRRMTLAASTPTAGRFAVDARSLRWKDWKSASPTGVGVLRIQQGRRSYAAQGQIILSGLVGHVPDGCGHSDLDRIYIRAEVVLDGSTPRRFRGRFAIRLPRTGCETS